MRPSPFTYHFGNSVDALNNLVSLVRFLDDLQGEELGSVTLSREGQEGFRFLLNFVEDTLLQVSEEWEKGDNCKKNGELPEKEE